MWSYTSSWWRHQMEAFSTLLAICAGNSPVPGEFPAQRPVTRSFEVCFYLRLNKRFSKHSWGWWFETQSHPLWRHSNDKNTITLSYCRVMVNGWRSWLPLWPHHWRSVPHIPHIDDVRHEMHACLARLIVNRKRRPSAKSREVSKPRGYML